MKVSVIIPTHNRLSILKKCLNCIYKQDFEKNSSEIIIVDDGSNDGTKKWCEEATRIYGFPLRYFFQNQAGPAKARNKGIQEALGEVLIFIGDDILISPSFVTEHYKAHLKNSDSSVCVTGKIEWDKDLKITDFMRYLENGIQFDFNNLNGENISYKNCYTSNISVKKDFIINNKIFFSEKFPYAAYEDTEWGYRLMKAGGRFVYRKEALAWHDHEVTLSSYSKRMILAGRAYAYLLELHPEIDPFKAKQFSYAGYINKFIKAKLRSFILKTNLFPLSDRTKEKWIKGILSYYEEKGFLEGIKTK